MHWFFLIALNWRFLSASEWRFLSGANTEGVENNLQLKFLKENHCDDVQGYLFAKPMPSAEFEQILTRP